MNHFIQLTTLDNASVFINKDRIDAIEEVAGTSRSESYLKLYVGAYYFKIKISLEELKTLI